MNKFIEQQLHKLTNAEIQKIDSTNFYIPKKVEIQIKVNSYYMIEVADWILDPTISSILAVNWNNNRVPDKDFKIMKIEITQILNDRGNKLIKVTGIAFDPVLKKDINKTWTGWLPVQNIKFLEELK